MYVPSVRWCMPLLRAYPAHVHRGAIHRRQRTGSETPTDQDSTNYHPTDMESTPLNRKKKAIPVILIPVDITQAINHLQCTFPSNSAMQHSETGKNQCSCMFGSKFYSPRALECRDTEYAAEH